MDRHTFDAVLPERVYAVGSHRSGEIAVPTGHGTFDIRIGVAKHLDPETLVAVGLDISLDGGQTWQADGAASRRGGAGTIERTTALPMASMTLRGRLWGETARGRAVRVRVVVQGHATTLGPVDLGVSDEPINPSRATDP